MNSSKLSLIVVLHQMFLSQIVFGYWNYKENGPDEWPREFSQCNGIQQSPIDLVFASALFNNRLRSIHFNNYDREYNWNVTNDGTSIYGYLLEKSIIPWINGSNFNEDFRLIQFHFHWGYNAFQGSEHRMNGIKYPLEIHLVHQSNSGRLAVVGFLYQLGRENTRLHDLLEAAKQTIFKNDMMKIRLNLRNILPDFDEANRNGYFRYNGSLTTPPCTEGIIWTVYRQAVPISESQLKSFYSNKVEMNFRDVQPLNGRRVEISIQNSQPGQSQFLNLIRDIFRL